MGIALFDSIFIAIPALSVYGLQGGFASIAGFTCAVAIAHGIGVLVGSRTSKLIPQDLLKRGVAIFSICFSFFMLLF